MLRPAILLLGCAGIMLILIREHSRRLQGQAQVELREHRQRYQNLLENAHDWIWEVDAQGRYTYVSPRVSEFLGYEPDEILGRTRFELMPAAEASRVASMFEDIAADKRPFSGLENINLHRDGSRIVLASNGLPLQGPDGELLGYRGSDRNITEHKQLEQALRESEAHLRKERDFVDAVADHRELIDWTALYKRFQGREAFIGKLLSTMLIAMATHRR